jgi:hypothetical protein
MSAPALPHLVLDNDTPQRRQRRRAAFSQTDISRVLRAARQQGGRRVELERDGVIVRLISDEPVVAHTPDNGRRLGIVP